MEAVDDYIAQQPPSRRGLLTELRQQLQAALPDSEERFSYRMPTYWQKHNLIHFAACQNHLGIYPGPAAIRQFSAELTSYKTSKGAIQIPWEQDIPYELIVRIARWTAQRYG